MKTIEIRVFERPDGSWGGRLYLRGSPYLKVDLAYSSADVVEHLKDWWRLLRPGRQAAARGR